MGMESIYRLSLIMNMVDNITSPMAQVHSKVNDTVSSLGSIQAGFGNITKTGLGMMVAGERIMDAVLAPVEATRATRKAIGELASLGVQDLESIEKAARGFSDTWAGTTKAEFISAAYDIKSGVASLTDEGVAQFTEMAALTAKATKSTAGEMTSLFATGYGIYKGFYDDLSDLQFAEMFSAGISESVRAFKTSGSGMAQSIQSLGGSATTANVPLEEQLAILGMLQATMSGSEAGTKYRAFLRSAAKGGEELGLTFVDTNNQLLSMPEILDKLKGKFGETIDAAEKMELQKAFGTDEAVALIDLLYAKNGDLQDSILGLYDSMGQGADVATKMATAINNEEGHVVLQQRLQNIKETLGNSLLPTVNEWMGKIETVATKVGAWAEDNQELVGTIMSILLTLGGLLTVGGGALTLFGSLGVGVTKLIGFGKGFGKMLLGIPDMFTNLRIMALYAGDGVKLAFNGLTKYGGIAVSAVKNVGSGILTFGKQALTTAATALPGLIASVWSFTAALLANPVTWIVIGIIALIAAIILLWRNWDTVTAFLQNTWNSFIGGIQNGFNRLKEWFSGLPGVVQFAIAAFFPFLGIPMLIITNWGSIKEYFIGIGTSIKETFSAAIDFVKAIFSGDWAWIRESGAKLIETFTQGIMAVISKPIEAVKSGLAKIREMLPFSDAKTGPLSELTLSGQKVMDTMATGINQASNSPAQAVEGALSKIDLTVPSNIVELPIQPGAAASTMERQPQEVPITDNVIQLPEVVTPKTNLVNVTQQQQIPSAIPQLPEAAQPQVQINNSIPAQPIPNNVIQLPQTVPPPVEIANTVQAQAAPPTVIPFPAPAGGPDNPGVPHLPDFPDVPEPGDAPATPVAQQSVERVDFREIIRESRETSSETVREKDGGVHIGQVTLQVDLSDIEDIKKLKALLQELEDSSMADGIESA